MWSPPCSQRPPWRSVALERLGPWQRGSLSRCLPAAKIVQRGVASHAIAHRPIGRAAERIPIALARPPDLCCGAGDAAEGGWGDKEGAAAGGSVAKDDVASKFAPGIKFKLAV